MNRGFSPFQALCRSIIYQQISGAAAASIYKRFVRLFGSAKFPAPRRVQALSIPALRKAGLSPQKASYLKDLAEKFSDGTIRHRALHAMKSEDIVTHLTQVKGIGVWTVHMFLIFTLNRLDVLPIGDLGVRKGFQIVYRLGELPDAREMDKLAAPWREHASVASWYLWRVADEAKKPSLPTRRTVKATP